ncbi:hypothetical protein [Micromonospora mirobrigensis]|uniref:Uncharacterized protein n=1 Tax=Micromonospora mirobrigensis TaxID=262898 RepID=A0A1C4YNK2_9ACTN|nr:hypothetical protein [Micromonospora mirobrigensis]SCF22260.1 hypothetical protein GA0070564_104237 [Micromonospora mirobrigensis]
MTNGPAHASIVYWRKSLWNGLRCVPVLLTLEQGWLRARDRVGAEVFVVPVGQVGGRLTRLRTLLLDVDGRRYALVGRGASISPDPSREQQQALAAFRADRAAAPDGTEGPGFLDAMFNERAGWNMRGWRDALVAAGSGVRR